MPIITAPRSSARRPIPNKLHDLKATLDELQVYSPEQIEALGANLYLDGADRDRLTRSSMPAWLFIGHLDEDGQVDFKGKAKAFTRTYDFLASILPIHNAEWEKLSIFLNFLVPKLPAPMEEDLSKGILEAIDMDSYRAEKKAAMKIVLRREMRKSTPVPTEAAAGKPDPEMDRLSNILKTFNEQFRRRSLQTATASSGRIIRRHSTQEWRRTSRTKTPKKNTPQTQRVSRWTGTGMRVIGLTTERRHRILSSSSSRTSRSDGLLPIWFST